MKSYSTIYKEAGVDITAGYAAVELMKRHVARTRTGGVVSDIGGFGGAFALDGQIKAPVLVSSTDGVGTKLKLAFLTGRHDTIGIDCVAMCVNDIICCGAKPLFFLDYIAMEKIYPEKVAAIVSGVAYGCVKAGCALIGGETAEMPGFYRPGEYDLAGFATGIVDRGQMIDKNNVRPGDAVIGLMSSGIHSNGFSLVRKVLDVENRDLNRYSDELGMTLADALLTPTKIYVRAIMALQREISIHSLAHITGGGFYENIPRSIPRGLTAKIEENAVRVPPIFELIKGEGNIGKRDMFNTFNMGVGMIAIVSSSQAEHALSILREHDAEAYVLGEIVEGDDGIVLC